MLSLVLEGMLYLRTEAFSLAFLGIAIHHVYDRVEGEVAIEKEITECPGSAIPVC